MDKTWRVFEEWSTPLKRHDSIFKRIIRLHQRIRVTISQVLFRSQTDQCYAIFDSQINIAGCERLTVFDILVQCGKGVRRFPSKAIERPRCKEAWHFCPSVGTR